KDLERHAVRTCHRPPRAAAATPEHRRTWREAVRHRSKPHIESWSSPQAGPASIHRTIATGASRAKRMRGQYAEMRAQCRYKRRWIGCPAARVRYRFVATAFSAK